MNTNGKTAKHNSNYLLVLSAVFPTYLPFPKWICPDSCHILGTKLLIPLVNVPKRVYQKSLKTGGHDELWRASGESVPTAAG